MNIHPIHLAEQVSVTGFIIISIIKIDTWFYFQDLEECNKKLKKTLKMRKNILAISVLRNNERWWKSQGSLLIVLKSICKVFIHMLHKSIHNGRNRLDQTSQKYWWDDFSERFNEWLNLALFLIYINCSFAVQVEQLLTSTLSSISPLSSYKWMALVQFTSYYANHKVWDML